jgi:peptidoglycan/LPS O-acetylase OafA/YrhL
LREADPVRVPQALSSSHSQRSSRLRGLDGLRAFAAVSVVVYHVWVYGAADKASTDLGALNKPVESLRAGVALFFVLSGFLLYRPFAAAIVRGSAPPSIKRYLRNRARRILPPYWVALAAVGLFVAPALLADPLRLLANMSLTQNYVPSFYPPHDGLGVLPAWSLGVEIGFYLSLPLLVLVALRYAHPGRHCVRAALMPVAVLALVGVVGMIVHRVLEDAAATAWRNAFPPFAGLFALGTGLAVLHVLHEDRRVRITAPAIVAAAFVGVVSCLAATVYWYGGPLTISEYYSLLGVGAGALLLIVVCRPESRFVDLLNTRPLRITGLASYSLFLIHDPVIRALRAHDLTAPGVTGFAQNIALVGVVASAATAALYFCTERPVLRRMRRRDRSYPASAKAAP